MQQHPNTAMREQTQHIFLFITLKVHTWLMKPNHMLFPRTFQQNSSWRILYGLFSNWLQNCTWRLWIRMLHNLRPRWADKTQRSLTFSIYLLDKAAHLFRSPFENMITRFYLHLKITIKRNDTEDLSRSPSMLWWYGSQVQKTCMPLLRNDWFKFKEFFETVLSLGVIETNASL